MAAHELRYLYRRGRDLPDARRRLHDVLQRCVFSDVPELLRLAHTLDAWQEELLAYFTTGGVSNGPTEAINLLIKRIKRIGWRTQPAVATPVLVIFLKGCLRAGSSTHSAGKNPYRGHVDLGADVSGDRCRSGQGSQHGVAGGPPQPFTLARVQARWPGEGPGTAVAGRARFRPIPLGL
jgi:hypothetical protein